MQFKISGGPFGDQMCNYDVLDFKSKTLGEFVEEVIAENPKEYGDIMIIADNKSAFDLPRSEYKYGQIVTEFPKEYLDREIISVRSNGGWTLMTYFVKLKNNG